MATPDFLRRRKVRQKPKQAVDADYAGRETVTTVDPIEDPQRHQQRLGRPRLLKQINPHRLATIISDVFAPWIINIAFFLLLGATSQSWAAGVLAAIGTGVVPFLIVQLLMKAGRVDNRHVSRREHRGPVLALITVSVLATVSMLALMPTSRLVWAGMGSALVFLAAFAVVTLAAKIKASVHVGHLACISVFLAVTVSPWLALGLLFMPAVAWSRTKIRQHTLFESPHRSSGGHSCSRHLPPAISLRPRC